VTKPWDNENLRLTVSRALEHYETNKVRHELEMTNRRLLARLREIQHLSTPDEDNPPELVQLRA
jgi:FixJ family two-component response regulator